MFRQKFVGDLAGFRFLAVGKNAAGESGTGELHFWNDELTEVIRDLGDLRGIYLRVRTIRTIRTVTSCVHTRLANDC